MSTQRQGGPTGPPASIDPMLAQPSRTVAPTPAQAVSTLEANGLWLFEMKWDGARMIAFVADGVVRLRSRDGNDSTYRYPEIVAGLGTAFPTGTVILDGEVVVFGPDGRPSFPLSHRRDAQGNARSAAALAKVHPATFVAFDVLWSADTDARGWSYERRRDLLGELASAFKGSALAYHVAHEEGVAMYDFAVANRLEGVVAKRKDSTYRPGRSHAWIKLKPVRCLSALVRGHRPGTGRGAGALEIVLVGPDGLHPIGHVGAGLTHEHLGEINRRVAAGDPYVVVDVEFMEVSPAGQLRHPTLKGLRTDVDLTDCNISQLEG